MVTENTKIKRLTKWALFVGLGLIVCLLVGERYAPRYFGGSGDMIAGVLGAAFIIGWLVYRVLWPLLVILVGALLLAFCSEHRRRRMAGRTGTIIARR